MNGHRDNGRQARRDPPASARNGVSQRGDSLPLEGRLRAIGADIPPSNIDELWVFPPLPNRDGAAEFIVVSCYDGPGRRRVFTAHIEARFEGADAHDPVWVQRLREHGTGPVEWVAGLPDRLLGRLSDAGMPEVVRIEGRPEYWVAAVERFGCRGGANGNGAAKLTAANGAK